MDGNKNMMTSLTIWGGIQMALAWTLATFGRDVVSGDEAASLMDNLQVLTERGLAITGFLSVVVGRFRAKKKVTVI